LHVQPSFFNSAHTSFHDLTVASRGNADTTDDDAATADDDADDAARPEVRPEVLRTVASVVDIAVLVKGFEYPSGHTSFHDLLTVASRGNADTTDDDAATADDDADDAARPEELRSVASVVDIAVLVEGFAIFWIFIDSPTMVGAEWDFSTDDLIGVPLITPAESSSPLVLISGR